MVGIFIVILFFFLPPKFPCLSQDDSSYGLSYSGGKIMTQPVTVSLLWFGPQWQESDKAIIRNAINSLTSSKYSSVHKYEVPTLGNWWDIVRQYRDKSNSAVTDTLSVGPECSYMGFYQNVTRDWVIEIGRAVFDGTAIDGSNGSLSCTHAFETSENSIYLALFSDYVIFVEGNDPEEFTDPCSGEIPVNISAKEVITMAWTRALRKEGDQCSKLLQVSSYQGPPNGNEKVDSMVGYMLAKIADQVTNGDGRGWTSSGGNRNTNTISTLCTSQFERGQSHPPLYIDAEKNVSFNAVGLNGQRYLLQYLWDQSIRNCALKPTEACSVDPVILKRSEGHLSTGIAVNHSDGLQPYTPNQKCIWEIWWPSAKFISFKFQYFAVAVDSEDHLRVCPPDSCKVPCAVVNSQATNSFKSFQLPGPKVSIQFISGDYVSFDSRGWELSYMAGLCTGKEDVYNSSGIIGYGVVGTSSYVQGINCRWVLHGKPGTQVSLNFTHNNVTRDLDFIAIFNDSTHQIANFSGFYPVNDLPQIKLIGEVIIAFSTQTEEGEGWLAYYYISSPAEPGKRPLVFVTAVILVALALSLSIAIVALFLHKRKQKHAKEGLLLNANRFTREENWIGEGPSAVVYKAVHTDGCLLAIKVFKNSACYSELEEEILLKTSSHPYIISLMGHTRYRFQRRCMVFEFMSRGCLSYNLREEGETIDWEKRLTIAMQISSAIQMLHMRMNPPVCHGNITSDNILLDEFCNAKLGGFSSANYFDGKDDEELIVMREDVRSFGLLMLELLRGEPLENRNLRSCEEINQLVDGQDCLDRRLGIPPENSKMKALEKYGEIAKWCINSSSNVEGDENNPKIGDILSGLQQVKKLFHTVSSSEVEKS